MRRLATTILVAAFVAIGLWAPRGWAAGAPNGNGTEAAQALKAADIVKLINTARTPADHLKIAAWFDEQAKEARAEAKKFGSLSDCYSQEKNKAMYKGVAAGAGVHAHAWCSLQAHRYLTAAADDEKLANMHRTIAEQLAKAEKH